VKSRITRSVGFANYETLTRQTSEGATSSRFREAEPPSWPRACRSGSVA